MKFQHIFGFQTRTLSTLILGDWVSVNEPDHFRPHYHSDDDSYNNYGPSTLYAKVEASQKDIQRGKGQKQVHSSNNPIYVDFTLGAKMAFLTHHPHSVSHQKLMQRKHSC